MRFLGILLSIAMFSGCADTTQVTRTSGMSNFLSRQTTAYVGVPQDGRYGNTTYSGSGALVAQSVAAAFSPYFTRVTVGVRLEDFDVSRKSAELGGYTYLLYPEILHWEDRATEWSGKPDVASVKLSIIRVDTGAVIDSAVLGGKSGLATFGGDRPEHLLPKPLTDYAATMFRQ